jgi:predicted Zn-dependent protease
MTAMILEPATRAAVVALAALAACAKNPVTGERQLSLVSTEQEIALGKQSAEQITQQIGRYPDEKLQAYVSGIGMRMARASERPDLPWSFTVLDDPTVNAFALPGGPVFVTRGILTHMNSEAELASVLGHEIGHITARHSVDQISKAQLAQVGLGLGMIFSEDLRQYGQLAGVGLQLMFLKFGRDDERQSDELGFKYMVAQGYDPREMADMFRTLERASKTGEAPGRLPEWLSTHPDPGDRAEKALERAASVENLERLQTDREEFLAHLNGMVFGEDPRQGFFQGNAFLHPGLRFRVDFPPGWKTANTAAAVMGVSEKQDAAIQLTVAGKLSPEEASRKFFAQQGVKAASLQSGTVSGLPATASWFEAQTEQGAVRGLVSFVAHGGTTFQLVGFTGAKQLEGYAGTFQKSFASFGPLTDPAALAVQPAKVELVKVPRDMTVAEFHAQFPSTAPVAVVALVNGVPEDGRLAAGTTAKRIVGGQVPKS